VSRALAALAALALLAGCGGGEEGNEQPVVFAASSLGEAAPAVDPGAKIVLGGSNDLAAQIRDGARADVILSASPKPLADLQADGLVEEPVAFASNRLVVVAPRSNPGKVTHFADLARDGVKLVLGAEGVPVGDYAREALELAGLGAALDNVVSLEDDVKGVVGKVALGEADAGVVYATDVAAAGDDLRSYRISDYFQPEIAYYAALVSPGSEQGRDYLERLLGGEGQAALRIAGFRPAPS